MNETQNTPELRSEGFTEPWRRQKLGDISDIRTGSSDVQDAVEGGRYPFFIRSDEVIRSNKYVFDCEAILTPGEGRIGEVFHYCNGKFDCHQRVYKISDFKNVEAKFVLYDLQHSFKKHAMRNTVKATVDSLRLPTLMDFELVAPKSVEEQRQIASLFWHLDDSIALYRRRYKRLQRLKQALLRKMFPKPGEQVPELRFEGFTEPWKERRLGDVGHATSGVGFPDAEQGGSSGVPFFKVSDMNLRGNENEMTTANNYVSDSQISRLGWKPVADVPAMFFAKVGAAVALNRKRLVRMPFLMDNNTMAYSLRHEYWNVEYAKALFETLDLPSLAQTGALPSYNSSDVEDMVVLMPFNFDEQQTIGTFFSRLDALIALYQGRHERLQHLKQALLRKMFV